jgi:hypothetical protein
MECRFCDVEIPRVKLIEHESVCMKQTIKCMHCDILYDLHEIQGHENDCDQNLIKCNE